MPVKYGLSAKGVSRLFPFHVAFDKECNIVQAGAVRGEPDIYFYYYLSIVVVFLYF